MRVAYDAAPLLNPRAGIGQYAAALLDEMLKLTDLEFHLFALTRASNGRHIPLNDRVSFARIGIPARVIVTAWERVGWPAGELITRNSQVVHGTNFWIPPVKSTQGLVTIHDLTFLFYPEFCTPQVRRYKWIVPKVLKRCAAVIAPTETVKREVVEHLKFPADRIFVTQEGVSGRFRGAKADPHLLKRLGIDSEFVLFSGSQEPRKNLERLLRAFALVPDKELRLVITGPKGWGSVDLPSLSRELGVEDRVVSCGYLSNGDLANVISSATAYVFPSIYEGFGLPPLEAMAAGVPVVAARAGSLPEILGDAPVWCDPMDVLSIADAISKVVTDEPLRKAAIEAGSRVSSLYEWSDAARKTVDAYTQVASG